MSPSPRSQTIATTTHGRYYLEGEESPSAPLLVGFHGYGENALSHLKQLRRIEGVDDWLVCAVHALSLFYNSKTGDVLGSWMTSLGRDEAIADNIAYVRGVVEKVRQDTGAGPGLVFAGFSQGVAMAYRAAALCGLPCRGLIVLAGDVPPDVAAVPGGRLPPILLGRGTKDSWYTKEKMDQDLETLDSMGAQVETCVFKGGHDWGQEFVDACGVFLARRSALASSETER